VIGFAGSDEKATLLTEQFHFDEAFNYKTVDINEALRRSASKGVDVYFDNVRFMCSHIFHTRAVFQDSNQSFQLGYY